jgi:hypothetical protein
MRKLRDETIIRNVLLKSTRDDSGKPYSDESFERALQEYICLYEHETEQLEEKTRFAKHYVNLLVKSHFAFSRDRRDFIDRVYAKINHNISILDDYLASQSSVGAKSEEVTDERRYLRMVREGCEERKPWLPRPAFDAALIEAATEDYELDSI